MDKCLATILGDDVVSVEELIELFEALEDSEDPDELAELAEISLILDELKGYGGDVQFNGDWYPQSLIADSAFEDHARELAEDIGAIDRNAAWPLNHIDWKSAAEALQDDYSLVTIDGVDYWYR